MTSNRILLENARTDGVADKSYWDAASSAQIEGFATDMSVNAGSQIDFKINLDGGAGKDYKVEIFRLGYYGGSGAREVTEWTNTNGVDQALPLFDESLGLVDAGNWLVTDSWNVPTDAVSGVYLARLQMLGSDGNPIPGETNQIPFIVRNDGVEADIVLQTSDTTWQAYNAWHGGLGNEGQLGPNLYGDNSGLIDRPTLPDQAQHSVDRAYAVSYNRPFIVREGTSYAGGAHDYVFGADYAAIYFLEQQGYDVSYISGVDTDRLGPAYLQNYKAFISVGHDEYWSHDQRQNVENARDAGVNILFWSGNEVYWKTRWETSISADGTEYRTLVCYKETLAVADPNAGPEAYVDLDPTNIWTGTWRDTRFIGATDANGNYISGGIPSTITGMLSECACVETMLTGQLFGPDGTGEFGGALEVPAAFANLRVWRDTNVPTTGIAPGIIGYEWDISPTDATRPAGLIKLSETTLSWSGILIDQGMTTAPGVATHNLSLYRAASGALVFGAGTVFWTWGLSDQHDESPYGANIANTDLQQFAVNMFADMGIQPAVSNSILASQGLVRATASSDFVAATTTIANLPDTVGAQQVLTITGTAADFNGTTSTADDGKVAAVEVSVDNGATWRVANGTTNWSFTWVPSAEGVFTIKARSIDDSLNMTNMTPAQDTITVTAPVVPAVVSLFGSTPATGATLDNDNSQVELGMKFSVTQAGTVSALRYYRDAGDAGDTDVREGHLWSASGALLGTVTFTSTVGQTGWQTANFASGITLVAGQEYTVSYRTANNYISVSGFFAASREVAFDGLDNDAFTDPYGLVSAPQIAGVYAYGNSLVRPTASWNAANYFVDVLFQPAGATNTAPTIISGNYTVPENGTAIGAVVATDAQSNPITYAISGGVDAAKFTINASTGALFFLTAPNYEAPTDVGANNVYDITVSASDGIATSIKAVSVTVTDLPESGNTAPVITSGNYTIAENTTAVGAVTATDAQSNAITYAISGGADAAKFSINASTGALSFVAAPNYEAPTDVGANNVYDLIVSASDNIAAPVTKAVTVTVTDVAEATVSRLFASSVTPAGFESGATDPTNYELGTKFTAGQAGQITALQYYRGAADADDTDVRALSLWNASGVKIGTVTVTSAAGATGWQVGSLSSPIGIVAGQTYTVSYSYVFNNGQGAVESYANTGSYYTVARPSSDGLLTAPVNAGVYAGGTGLFPTASWNASSYFVDVLFQPSGSTNTAPTITSGNYAIAENGTAIGTVTATDAQSNAITYAISGGADAAKFTINASTGALSFVTAPDYEAPTDVGANNVYDIIVSASDGIAAATTKAVTVTVTDVAENTAPTIISGNYTVPENGTAIGAVVATDAQSNPITYAISGGVDAAKFTINASTGALFFLTAPNYEAPTDVGANNVYDITVSASDGIATSIKAVSVTVTDLPESGNTAPVITSGNYTIAENTTAVGAVTATDAQSNAITYAISGGADAAKFSINASTGALSFVAAPNYEAPTDVGANNVYDLIVSASDNIAAPVTKAVTVTVTDVAEATVSRLFASSVTPAGFESGATDPTNYELGTKFTAGQAGQITALQYYRGAADADDTDVRALSLWNASGVKIGTVTVTSAAGATGWQVGSLSSPIGIVAGQTYTVSYSYVFNNGQGAVESYANTGSYYTVARPSSDGLLTAPVNAGVYAGGTGLFPTASWNASSYFVDVLFQPSGSTNTAPTITSGNYAIAENGTAIGTVTATDAQSNAITYAISGGADAAKFTINASTGALSFVAAPNYEAPTDVGANNVYDLIVSASDNIAAPVTKAVTVTVTDVAEATVSRLFASSVTPAGFESGATDPTNYELGTKFTAAQAGQITALQYYRGAADADDTDVRALSLWNASGVKIGTVTVTSAAGATGWQVGSLSSPIAIVAGQTYTVSYSYVFNNGQGAVESYANTGSYYTVARPSSDGLLTAPVSAGVYVAGTGLFPTASWNASSYFVDVLFQQQSGAAPIVLDLNGDGLNLTSSITFDFDDDGVFEVGSWAGVGDAFLALDRNGDGVINGVSEISFVSDLPGATTDLEGLKAFDSNGDGLLSSGDNAFGDFLVWEDANQDGVSQASELRSLADAGVESIGLTAHEPRYADDQGNIVHGAADVTLSTGATVTAFDVELKYAETPADTETAQDTITTQPYSVEPVSETPAPVSDGAGLQGQSWRETVIERWVAKFGDFATASGAADMIASVQSADAYYAAHIDAPHPTLFDLAIHGSDTLI